eukprot:TRINITY_DN14687_c0_g1_i1.p1 TRINITY_DN14687_c0_g1~~TRINITY_DN14687_c0_g1_i1.p1  ORF type:complete len:891 (+),score=193.56 TRINITY_DN14687_c0_g1_i1:41-2674(+)
MEASPSSHQAGGVRATESRGGRHARACRFGGLVRVSPGHGREMSQLLMRLQRERTAARLERGRQEQRDAAGGRGSGGPPRPLFRTIATADGGSREGCGQLRVEIARGEPGDGSAQERVVVLQCDQPWEDPPAAAARLKRRLERELFAPHGPPKQLTLPCSGVPPFDVQVVGGECFVMLPSVAAVDAGVREGALIAAVGGRPFVHKDAAAARAALTCDGDVTVLLCPPVVRRVSAHLTPELRLVLSVVLPPPREGGASGLVVRVSGRRQVLGFQRGSVYDSRMAAPVADDAGCVHSVESSFRLRRTAAPREVEPATSARGDESAASPPPPPQRASPPTSPPPTIESPKLRSALKRLPAGAASHLLRQQRMHGLPGGLAPRQGDRAAVHVQLRLPATRALPFRDVAAGMHVVMAPHGASPGRHVYAGRVVRVANDHAVVHWAEPERGGPPEELRLGADSREPQVWWDGGARAVVNAADPSLPFDYASVMSTPARVDELVGCVEMGLRRSLTGATASASVRVVRAAAEVARGSSAAADDGRPQPNAAAGSGAASGAKQRRARQEGGGGALEHGSAWLEDIQYLRSICRGPQGSASNDQHGPRQQSSAAHATHRRVPRGAGWGIVLDVVVEVPSGNADAALHALQDMRPGGTLDFRDVHAEQCVQMYPEAVRGPLPFNGVVLQREQDAVVVRWASPKLGGPPPPHSSVTKERRAWWDSDGAPTLRIVLGGYECTSIAVTAAETGSGFSQKLELAVGGLSAARRRRLGVVIDTDAMKRTEIRQENVVQVRRIFDEIDADKSGVLSLRELISFSVANPRAIPNVVFKNLAWWTGDCCGSTGDGRRRARALRRAATVPLPEVQQRHRERGNRKVGTAAGRGRSG